MTPIDAGHPDYDASEFDNPEDYRPGADGNSFAAETLVGVPILLYGCDFQASKQDGGGEFAVLHGRFCEHTMRLANKDGEIVPEVTVGEPFSTSTGAKMVVPVLRKLVKDGKLRSMNDGERVRGVIGRVMKGKAAAGKRAPLSFVIATVDEQRDYRAAVDAADSATE